MIVMNRRSGTNAAVAALLLGIALVIAIGFAGDEIRLSVTDTAKTAQINDGADEIARGPARVAPLAGPQLSAADSTRPH
jgi:hypothetical protein